MYDVKVWLDENELTQVIKIFNINRDVMPERINTSIEVPQRHGAYYTGHRYGIRKVSIEYLIIGDDLNNLEDFKKVLAKALDLERPAKLQFSDEPDRFLYAVLDGTTEVTEVLNDGRGTLNFVCHDPFYYSTTEKEFTADANGLMVINNQGTISTEPRFELDFTGDCGFIAIASPDGIIQIGNTEQLDEVALPKQEKLLNLSMTTTSGWTVNSTDTKLKTAGATIQGTVGTTALGIKPTSFGTPTSGYTGASIIRDLPASIDTSGSARYFEATFMLDFKSIKSGAIDTKTVRRDIDSEQKGVLEVSLTDENNNYLAGIRFQDSTVYHDMTIPEFWVGGQRVWRENISKPAPKKQRYTYKVGGKVKTGYKKLYADEVGKWNDFYGTITIKKYWDRIVFDLQKLEKVNGVFKVVARKTHTQMLSQTQRDQRAKTVQVWFGRYGSEPVIDTMAINQVIFNKLNTSEKYDVANTFQSGDQLVVDTDENTVFLNGASLMNDLEIGSQFFDVVAGETEVKLIHSSFDGVAQPTFKAYIREKWL